MTWFFVALVFSVTVWIWLELRKRRLKTWLQRDRYHAPLPSVTTAQKLGLEGERMVAQRPDPDYDAEIEVIEASARKRGTP